MEIDVEELRRALMDHYGTAMQLYPQAVVDLTQVEHAAPEQLLQLALDAGLLNG